MAVIRVRSVRVRHCHGARPVGALGVPALADSVTAGLPFFDIEVLLLPCFLVVDARRSRWTVGEPCFDGDESLGVA